MAKLNTARVIFQATDALHRSAVVRKDPAVVKALKEVQTDLAQAGRSTSNLVHEVQAAWRRSDSPRAGVAAQPA